MNPKKTMNISQQKVLRKISPDSEDVKKVTTLNPQREGLNVNGLLKRLFTYIEQILVFSPNDAQHAVSKPFSAQLLYHHRIEHFSVVIGLRIGNP
jgi:hypothetical protein